MSPISIEGTLHGVILNEIQSKLLNVLTVVHNSDREEINLNQQLSAVFYNFRIKDLKPLGLRLSKLGNKLLSKVYVNYKYEHTQKITHKTFIVLDKNMVWPYYITNTHITFYSAEDAVWFRLNGQNLDNYIEYF
jgi:hypothetical protein